jgi:hypothetical protein
MNFIPTELFARLLKMLEAASKFGRNTHENVDRSMKEIIEELVIKGECFDTNKNR